MCNEKLKPCPFCGVEANLEKYVDQGMFFVSIYCQNCGAMVKRSDRSGVFLVDYTIAVWNKRTITELPGRLDVIHKRAEALGVLDIGIGLDCLTEYISKHLDFAERTLDIIEKNKIRFDRNVGE